MGFVVIRLPRFPKLDPFTGRAFEKAIQQDKKFLFTKNFLQFFPQYPQPEIEKEFHQLRKWRFDCAWVDQKIAVEIEGGIWRRKGAHNTGLAITRDIEKSNAALLLGWRVLRFTVQMLEKDPHSCCSMAVQLLDKTLWKN